LKIGVTIVRNGCTKRIIEENALIRRLILTEFTINLIVVVILNDWPPYQAQGYINMKKKKLKSKKKTHNSADVVCNYCGKSIRKMSQFEWKNHIAHIIFT